MVMDKDDGEWSLWRDEWTAAPHSKGEGEWVVPLFIVSLSFIDKINHLGICFAL